MESLCKERKIHNYESVKQEPSSEAFEVSVTKNIAQRVQKLELRGPLERRCSPRLKNLPQEKRPCYDESQSMEVDALKHDVCKKETGDYNPKRELESPGDDAVQRRSYVDHSMQKRLPNIDRNVVEVGRGHSRSGLALGSLPFKVDDTEFDLEDNAYLKWTEYQSFAADSIKEMACAEVKQTEGTFNFHYPNFAKEEEKRYENVEVTDPQVANCTNNKGSSSADSKCSSKIPMEISEISKKKEQSFTEKQFAHPPGILAGHKFFSRDDMVATGFRGHWLNGIDFIHKLCSKWNNPNEYSSPVAVAILLSGQYEDGVDCSNEVLYTGQGRNSWNGSKHQINDKVMCCGNLALKNNMEQSVPVRVIRGHKRADSHSGEAYTYCGMYKVVRCWSVKRDSGFFIFKYRLKRLQWEPKIEIDEVYFEQERCHNLHGLVCEDISSGVEDIRIPVTNVIDNPPIAPAGFKYIKSVQVAKNVIIPPSPSGCDCKEKCTNPESCSCAQRNGSGFPYVHIDGGRLIEPKDVVFECGPGCGCGPSCINRVSQHGLQYQLEVYRTENKGWAVRSWDLIPSGAPVCEYLGILSRNDELDNVSENEFIFDIDCWHTMNEIGGRERRQGDGSASACDPLPKVDVKMDESESEFCIDAGSCGNIARFINHSCMPNLFVQCVLSTHYDIRLARIVLFAADDILPMQELTYDYGYILDSVVGPDGKLKQSHATVAQMSVGGACIR